MADITLAFTVEVTTSEDATIAKVYAEGVHFVSEGTAKRHPSDTYDAQTGLNLAVARALSAYVDRIGKTLA